MLRSDSDPEVTYAPTVNRQHEPLGRLPAVVTCTIVLCAIVSLLIMAPEVGSSLPSNTRAEIQRLSTLSAVTPDRPSRPWWSAGSRAPAHSTSVTDVAARVAFLVFGNWRVVPPSVQRLTASPLCVGLSHRGPPA